MKRKIEMSLGESNDCLSIAFPQESPVADIPLEIPVAVKKEGLPVDDAMAYIKEAAAGKKKIARSLTDKGAPTTGYDTFDEMAERIDMLPLPVEGEDEALSPNGGVLKFYDVYNELRKVNKLYGGKYPYCCAIDITNSPSCDTVTLSGADAYYTSDGAFYEQTTEHSFNDKALGFTNRFVVYLFTKINYSVPFNLPWVSVNKLYVLNGKAMIYIKEVSIKGIYNYSADYTDVTDNNKFGLFGLDSLSSVYSNSVSEISGGRLIFCELKNLQQLSFPNLTTISGGVNIFYNISPLKRIHLPKLTTISGGTYIFNGLSGFVKLELLAEDISGVDLMISNNVNLKELSFPKLKSFTSGSLIYNNTSLESVYFPELEELGGSLLSSHHPKLTTLLVPKLKEYKNAIYPITSYAIALKEIDMPSLVNALAVMTYDAVLERISLGNPVGGNIRICSGNGVTAVNNTLTTLTVGEGFRSRLDCTACDALTHDSLVGILNNLADNTDGAAINIIFGAVNLAKLTEDEIAVGTSKNYTIS